ncbi:unnamed protein product, partial [Polarella glacialis]
MQFVSSNFGCERVTASAGSYKLCFCTPRGAGASCQLAYDFSFDIGTMVVQGPLRNQARKCVFGYRCWAEDIQGVGLADGDLILVLDKCRMPQTSPAAGNMTIRGIAGLTPGAGVPAYGKDGSQYLLAETVLAIAGTYRMCWCRPSLSATGCGITDSFAADIGGITVVTPALSLLRRCVRGQTCAIIDLEGFGLADGDAVHVLHFCPDKPNYGIFQEDVPPTGVFIDGWPRKGLSLPAEIGGTSVSWGVEVVMAPVGRYPICWCMGSSPFRRCDQPQ